MTLTNIRNSIDAIDQDLIKLFIQRMELSKEVALTKASLGLPLCHKDRENEILMRVESSLPSDLSTYGLRLFQTLFELSKAYQQEILATPEILTAPTPR